jgi:GT2 family glycosyltransferase
VLALGANLGFAAANNRGAAGAATPWLATLNPDAFPEPDWLARLLAAAEAHPGAVMLGSTQLLADAPDRFDGTGDCYLAWGFAWRGDHRRPTGGAPYPAGAGFAPCAAAALYDRAAFESAGGFDERYFCYLEDVDLAFRLRLAGGRCFQAGDAVVRHVSSGIVGRGSDFALYHGARNQLWTFAKDMPGPLLWLNLPGFAAIMVAMWLRLLPRGQSGVLWRGVRDAVAGLAPILASRRDLQRDRTATIGQIARALTWNPWRFATRRGDLRPWTSGRS